VGLPLKTIPIFILPLTSSLQLTIDKMLVCDDDGCVDESV
jgi:hypothetical protein